MELGAGKENVGNSVGTATAGGQLLQDRGQLLRERRVGWEFGFEKRKSEASTGVIGTDGNDSPGVMDSTKENEIPRAQTS